MEIRNSKDPQVKPSIIMMVYGEGGVGKTTFGATAPKPLLADCENGSKYFGLRDIDVDVAQIKRWGDMKEFYDAAVSGDYETIIIDPIGELMEKLKQHMIASGNSKLVQKDGAPTMAGWGFLKDTMRNYLKALRDSGKHVILVAHLDEKSDEERMIKRPQIATKLSDEIVNMVDVVAYMTVIDSQGESKRVLIVDAENDKYTAKDRTGQLGKVIEPDFDKIVKACQGTEEYTWSKPKPVKKDTKKAEPKAEKTEEVKEKQEPEVLSPELSAAITSTPKEEPSPAMQKAKEAMVQTQDKLNNENGSK